MKVLKGKKKLCAVKATTFFIELLFVLEMMEELSSADESTASQSDSEARQGKCGTRTRTSSNAVELIAIEALSSSTSWGVRVECPVVDKVMS